MTARLHSFARYLYRWRWLTSALLMFVFVVFLQVGERPRDAFTWAAFGFCALLLWVPIALRWLVSFRDSGRAFRAGLSDD